jgi:hypothetical protein
MNRNTLLLPAIYCLHSNSSCRLLPHFTAFRPKHQGRSNFMSLSFYNTARVTCHSPQTSFSKADKKIYGPNAYSNYNHPHSFNYYRNISLLQHFCSSLLCRSWCLDEYWYYAPISSVLVQKHFKFQAREQGPFERKLKSRNVLLLAHRQL